MSKRKKKKIVATRKEIVIPKKEIKTPEVFNFTTPISQIIIAITMIITIFSPFTCNDTKKKNLENSSEISVQQVTPTPQQNLNGNNAVAASQDSNSVINQNSDSAFFSKYLTEMIAKIVDQTIAAKYNRSGSANSGNGVIRGQDGSIAELKINLGVDVKFNQPKSNLGIEPKSTPVIARSYPKDSGRVFFNTGVSRTDSFDLIVDDLYQTRITGNHSFPIFLSAGWHHYMYKYVNFKDNYGNEITFHVPNADTTIGLVSETKKKT